MSVTTLGLSSFLEDSQIQILNQCQHFIVVFLADECLDFLEGDVLLLGDECFRVEFPSDEPIGNVNMIPDVLCGSVALQ